MPGLSLDHHGRKGANTVEDAAQIRVQHPVPLLWRHLMQRPPKTPDASVIHQNVDSPKFLADLCRQRLNRLWVSNVAFHYRGFPASFDNGLGAGVQRNPVTAAEDGHSTQTGQLLRDGGADPSSSACNHGHLWLE